MNVEMLRLEIEVWFFSQTMWWWSLRKICWGQHIYKADIEEEKMEIKLVVSHQNGTWTYLKWRS